MEVSHLKIDDPKWPEVLGRLPHDIYHLPEYVKIDGECNHAEPKAFVAREGEKELFIPYLVRRCDTLFPGADAAKNVLDVVSPYGYPGLLLSEAARTSPDFARSAMEQFCASLSEQGVCSAFLRMHPLFSGGFLELFPENYFTASSETVAIDLTQEEGVIWKGIRDGHRWTIKKCKKLGFEARMVPLSENIDAFMAVYTETMDRVGAKDSYYFGRDYFEKLAAMPDSVHCCMVALEGHAAAAVLFFEVGGIVQAHLGGTKSEYLSKSPFHLVLHHGMEWAKSRGNRYFHLGGGVGGSNDRLLHFKRGFSDLIFPFLTLRLVTNEDKYRELVVLSANAASVAVEGLQQSEYFPAYRTPH